MGWLRFDSLVNARDLGGTPIIGGEPLPAGRLLRSDHLQNLTEADLRQLADLGVSDVVDLRSNVEDDREGPGPMTRVRGVKIHRFSYLPETDSASVPDGDAASAVNERVLPWIGIKPTVAHKNPYAAHYLSYLADMPEQVVGALRAIAQADGAVLVHCAAGKDRTGTTIALALALIGAQEDAIVADYAASSQRMQLIVDKLASSPTYRDNLVGRPLSSHMTRPESMRAFLDFLREEYGGVQQTLQRIGWTEADTKRLRAKLLG